jgi:protein-S-isoprenylcysteine O-methyltransferase Ste14
MYWFLIPLILGFASNLASAFTKAYSEKWGKTAGTLITIILRDFTGIPVWAIGFILAINESSVQLFQTSLLTKIIGWSIILFGAIIIIIALITIRIKAAAPKDGDTLVKNGLYSLIRHPIHSGTLLEFAGLFFLRPSLQVGIASVTGIIWIFLQTHLEEYDLKNRIPEYKEYMKQVPRFIPFFRSGK